MERIIFLILIKLLFSTILISQDTTKVSGATGIEEIAGRISEREARNEALNNAKVEALRKAGVSEHLQSYEMLFRSETDRDYSEFFSSDVHSELRGAVKSYDVVDEQRKVDPQTNLFTIEVTIDAIVVKYTSRTDPAFNVNIEGVEGVYERGENLNFSVYSSMDSYLHIFNITDDETLLVYPNEWEEQKMIQANENVEFPFGHVNYELEKQSSEPETNRLVFVFTKEPVQFLDYSGEHQFTTQEDLFSWIYGLTPDIRRVDYQVFVVR